MKQHKKDSDVIGAAYRDKVERNVNVSHEKAQRSSVQNIKGEANAA